MSAPGGCVCSGGVSDVGGVCSGGVSAPRGSAPGGSYPGGVCSGGLVSQHALRQTPPINRITDISKNNLGHNFVAAGNNCTC